MPYYYRDIDIDECLFVSSHADYRTVMCEGFERQENAHIEAATSNNSTPTNLPSKNPSPLQWVPVGKGGKVANVRTVRSHVSKEYHQRKRESQKADLQKLIWQRRVELRPSESENSTPKVKPKSEEVCEQEQEYELPKSLRIPQRLPSPSPTSTSTIQHQGYLIPYAWFEKDGPILYVNRSKWPFHTPLSVTGSDREDHRNKSLTPRQSGWMPDMQGSDFMAVKGAVLDANVLLWIGQSPECFEFRVEAIKWIQQQLEDRSTAISNRTLGSIMTFAMWTAGYSNLKEMISHMDAIERIVNLRGGFDAFDKEETMVRKLTLFDSMIAVLTGHSPRLPKLTFLTSSPVSPAKSLYITHLESPLYGLGDFEKIIAYQKDESPIISLLKKMWILTQNFELQRQNSKSISLATLDQAVPFVENRQFGYNTPLLTLPLLSRCANPIHNHVLETLLSASVIYSGSLALPPIDFPSPRNDEAFQQLCTAFSKCSDDDFWVCYPGILLWILLIATASARGKRESAFWMFYLSRTGNFSNADGWLIGNAAVRKFLDIQSRIMETGGMCIS